MRNPTHPNFHKAGIRQVPSGWNVAMIKDFATVKSGGTPSRGLGATYFGGAYPWVKTGDLTNGALCQTEEFITEEGLKESSCNLFPPDTVLIAMYGGLRQIGRTGLLRMAAATNQAISAICQEEPVVHPKYLLEWTNFQLPYWQRIAASSRKDPNITKRDIETFPVLYPQSQEQAAIVDILSTWDRGIEQAERLLALKEQRKRALMQQLLTGKRRFPEFVPSKNGKWAHPRAAEIFAPISRKRHGHERVLSVTQDQGVVYRDELDRKIATNAENTHGYKLVEPDDYVISLRSFQGGIEHSSVRGLVSPAYHVIRAKHEISPDYYRYFFKSRWFIDHLAVAVIGIRDGKQISFDDFGFMRIPQPPIEEQRRIAAVLKTCDAELRHLRDEVAALKQQKKGLMQKLLTGQVRP